MFAGDTFIKLLIYHPDMKAIRSMNVITLSVLLLLTGCFGLVDDEMIPPSEGESTNATEPNNPPFPIISSSLMEFTLESSEGVYANDGSLTGFSFMLYYSVIDIDGDNLTSGWDTDLDGNIDIPTSESSGFTTFEMGVNVLNELDGFGYENYYFVMLAFISIDEHGLGATDFAEVYLYDRDGYDDGNTDGNLALYAFSGKDAQGTPGTDTDDNLIMVTMDQGGDINWASISVKLSVDGAAPVTCDNPGGSGGVCGLVEFGTTDDQVWSVGDGVTIVETGTDVCSGDCTIDVTITDTREGKTIDTTNGVPAE